MNSLTIYHGAAKPLKIVGKNQCHLAEFAEKFPGWHSYREDRATRRAIEGLKRRGCLETNEFKQFRFIYPS